MMVSRWIPIGLVALALGAAGGCSSSSVTTGGTGYAGGDIPEVTEDGGAMPEGGLQACSDDEPCPSGLMCTGGVCLPQGGAVGDACSDDDPCRPGLACAAGTCEPGRETPEGAACLIAGECQPGLQCVQGVCVGEGEGELGAPCAGDQECRGGLRCAIVGFAAQCVPEGEADLGKSCDTSSDCFAGLLCAPTGECAPVPPGAISFGLPSSPSIDCAEPSDGDVEALFEVPGAGDADPEADFFRLPFPNDVRRRGGKLDLEKFPTPGAGILGFDPVERYIDALVEHEAAWGAYPTVTFRFSGRIDFETFRFNDDSGRSAVAWIDVTDPESPRNAGARWHASSGGTRYICPNWLGVRRPTGAPLEPGRTYAVYLTTDGRADDGSRIQRSAHFEALLASSAPGDARLAEAHAAFAPFRAYLAAEGIDPDTILNASVITVGPVTTPMSDLAAAVQAAPVPAASDWVRCAAGASSPCPQAEGDRGCGEGTADYDDYQALVTLPVFQRGTAPYLTEGGDIQTSGPVRQEPVCLSLTVPKTEMPGEGWPIVVFGHGTGGSFRSHVRPEVAGALATAARPMAVLGIDQVQHGPRRGDSTESPDNLFFNFANPAAARGNPLQGAADVIALGRFAAALDVTVGSDAIRADADAVLFYGHSQGAMHGSLGLPHAPEYRAAVLSGNGASLIHALLHKKAPVNIAQAVPFVLGDFNNQGELAGGDMHPVLSLLQHWIDPADPLSFGRLLGDPPDGAAKHVFQTYGLGDTYSPPITLETYARAAGLAQVAADPSADPPDELSGMPQRSAPFSGNVEVEMASFTQGFRQYGPPAGRDGHFVVFDVESATADVVRFLAMAAAGEVPEIGR